MSTIGVVLYNLIYLAIIIFYARYMNRLDREYGVDEGDDE